MSAGHSSRGASEVLGTVMLICIVTLALSCAGVFLFSQPQPQKVPVLHLMAWSDNSHIYLRHEGGDPLEVGQFRILVNGTDQSARFTLASDPGRLPDTFSIGKTLVFSRGQAAASRMILVYNGSGAESLLFMANPDRDLLREQQDPGPAILPPDLPAPPAPPAAQAHVTGIAPSRGLSGDQVRAALTGDHLLPGAAVILRRADHEDIQATGIAVQADGSSLACTFDLRGQEAGRLSVVVANPGGGPHILADGFEILSEPLTLVSPNQYLTGKRGWDAEVALEGTGFMQGSAVNLFRNGGSQIACAPAVVEDPHRLTSTCRLLDADEGMWNIVVTGPDGTVARVYSRFQVASPSPRVNSVDTNTGRRGARVHIQNIGGDGFQPGPRVAFIRGPGALDLANVQVISPGQISGDLQIPSGAERGAYKIRVGNTDGRTGISRNSIFSVT